MRLLASARVPQVPQRLQLDLADPLRGDPELPPHLLECPGVAVEEPEAELDYLPLAFIKRLQHGFELLLEQSEEGGVGGLNWLQAQHLTLGRARESSPTGLLSTDGRAEGSAVGRDVAESVGEVLSRDLAVGLPATSPRARPSASGSPRSRSGTLQVNPSTLLTDTTWD